MSGLPPDNTTDPFDQLSMRYLRRLLDASHPADEPYVLSETENQIIRQVTIQTIVLASALGVLGIVFLYTPQLQFPAFFLPTTFVFMGESVQVPIIIILYSLLLAYLAIYGLLYINTRAVRIIMDVCQFPKAYDAQYEQHLRALDQAAREHAAKGILRFSLSPYPGMPRWGLNVFFVGNTLWAILSNLALFFILKLFLGPIMVRQIAEFAGIPIFAFWFSFACWQVIHEAKVRIMAPLTIREFVDELYSQWGRNPEFRRLIVDSLQYSTILERQYNYAHNLLTETIINRFELDPAPVSEDFLLELKRLPIDVRCGLERLIIFGAVVDGCLSRAEIRQLKQLRANGWLSTPISQIKQITKEFTNGRGLWV